MKLSAPLWTAFINRRHQTPLLFLKTVNKCTRHARLSLLPLAFATSSMSMSSSATTTTLHPSIEDLTKKLDSLAPRFELQKGEITVLTTPEEFYTTLRTKILGAKKRVYLSSLYIGKEETELVIFLFEFGG